MKNSAQELQKSFNMETANFNLRRAAASAWKVPSCRPAQKELTAECAAQVTFSSTTFGQPADTFFVCVCVFSTAAAL